MKKHPFRLLSRSGRVRTIGGRSALALMLALLPGGLRQIASAASSAPPDSMTYQGFLVDANGNPLAPVTPQNYPVAFRIYSSASGGASLVWSEQQIVTVDKGSFNVLLGEGTPIGGELRPALSSVFAGSNASDRFISAWVTIGATTAEILPRLRLVPSPYSFLATSANNLVQPNGSTVVSFNSGQVNITGNVSASGIINGNGSGLTGLTAGQIPALDASKIVTGVFNDARIPTLLTGNRSFSGTVAFGANVGIGAAAPSERLQVGDFGVGADQYVMTATAGGNQYRSGVKLRHFNDGYGWTLLSDERDSSFRLLSHLADPNGVTRLLVDRFSGNVGLGSTTPGFPLTFADAVGDKISLWGQGGNHYGFGIQGGTLQIHTDGAGSDIVFGYGSSGNLTERMRIKGNGDVFVGSGASAHLNVNHAGFSDSTVTIGRRLGDNYALVADGNVLKPGGGSWGALSDRRLKTVLGEFKAGLNEIVKLETIRYRYKEDAAKGLDTKTEYFGFVAQDVEPLIPEAVNKMSDGYLVLNLDLIYLAAVNAIKELNTQTQSLGKENAELKKRLEELESKDLARDARLATLEGMVNKLARADAGAGQAGRRDAGNANGE